MKKIYNIAVVGLGQVGIYLLNELNTKKKSIEIKTVSIGRKILLKKKMSKKNSQIY